MTGYLVIGECFDISSDHYGRSFPAKVYLDRKQADELAERLNKLVRKPAELEKQLERLGIYVRGDTNISFKVEDIEVI